MELLTVIPEIIDVYRNKLKKKNPDLLKGILLSASDEPYTLYIDYRKWVRNHQYSIVDIEIKEKEDPPEWTNLA